MARPHWLVPMLLAGCAPSAASTYYVDWAQGADSAAGTSPGAPWKHAPGDPEATGAAAAARPGAGDTVLFKGGVAYRGAITVNGDGADGRPLTFSGAGYGEGAAIMDGADPVQSSAPCPSAEACGGAADWRKLTLVTYTSPPAGIIKLFDAKGPLVEAQLPAPADPFYADDVSGYLVSPLSEKTAIESGRLKSPELARRLGGKAEGQLSIWVWGNLVERRPITGIDGDTLLFTPDNIRLYDNRDGRYALAGTPVAISAPGQYAVLGPGKAVVWTRDGGGALEVGNGRGGFDLAGHSHLVIKGFTFTRQTGAEGKPRDGLPVSQQDRSASDIAITGNSFRDAALWNGQGVITLKNVDGVRVENNVIDTIERGSGLRAGFHVAHVKVAGNSIRRVGRTGIAFLGVDDSSIENNVIDGLRGIHGNGISLYLNNRRVLVAGNRVTATTRPMTFHGDKNTVAPGDHALVIERNLFLATPDAQAALTSWGANTRGVTIRNNVAIAPKAGLLLDTTDSDVVVTGNLISDMKVKGAGPASGWKDEGNRRVDAGVKVEGKAAIAPFCRQLGLTPGTILGAEPC